jgi:hypothetical protein
MRKSVFRITVICESSWNLTSHSKTLSHVFFISNIMTLFTYINWRTSRQMFSNNGCLANYVRPEEPVEVSRSLSFGSSTTFSIVVGNCHYQHWYSHRKRYTLASHLFSKEIAQCLLFRFVWSVSFRLAHINAFASRGTDKQRLRPVCMSIFCLCGWGYTQ